MTSDDHAATLSTYLADQALTLKVMLEDLEETTTPETAVPLSAVTKAQLDVIQAWGAAHEVSWLVGTMGRPR